LIRVLLLLFLVSCDFSPKLHRDILNAQDLIHEQKYLEATQLYEKILKGLPAGKVKIKVLYQLGDLYSIHLEKFKKGIYYYEKIVESSDETLWVVKSQERIGELNFSYLQSYKKASFYYRSLVDIIPKLKEYDFYEFRLGLSHMEMGQYVQALKIFNEIKINPLHKYFVSSYYHIGLTHFKNKDWQKAVDIWREYIKREKRRDRVVNTKFLMANAYETMENLSKAYSIYYSIQGEYPNTKVIQNRLNSVYQRKVAKKR
jgi:tetratricopeptide (TPR) repeat protein